MKTLICTLALAVSVFAQSVVRVSQAPTDVPIRRVLFCDNALQSACLSTDPVKYVCIARQDTAQTTTVQRSDSTLTSIVVLTNVGTVTTASAHGLYQGARVTITGATVDTDLNASYVVQSVSSSTVYTITTASVGNATYTDAGLVISTREPLTTASLWAIQVVVSNASAFATGAYWANASTGYALACSNRTSY